MPTIAINRSIAHMALKYTGRLSDYGDIEILVHHIICTQLGTPI